MKRNIVVFGVMVVVLAGLLMLAIFRRHLPGAAATASTQASKGAVAPDFTLLDLSGKPVKLSELRGKPVLLNFWATWCGPCQKEVPWLVEASKRHAADGLEVLGVAMDDGDPKDVASFALEHKVSYPVLLGKEEVASAYGGIDYLPTTFYIDRQGRIAERVFGQPSPEEIEANIQRILH